MIKNHHKIIRTKSTFSINLEFEDDKIRVAIWRPYIRRHYRDKKDNEIQPFIRISFRTLIDEFNLSSEIEFCSIPIDHLPLIPIGTIWKNNRCIGYMDYMEDDFFVDFGIDGRTLVNSHSKSKNKYPTYPTEIHPITSPESLDLSWLIKFKLENDAYLLIPSLELYSATYGSSSEITRILMTYDWEAAEERLFQNEKCISPNGKPWNISPKKRFNKDDAIFLAHLANNPHAQLVTKAIYSHIESKYRDNKDIVFPRVMPWFNFKGNIRVKGIPFNGTSFLGLEITGFDLPPTPKITRILEDGKTKEEIDVKELLTSSQKYYTKRVSPPDDLEIINDESPAFGSIQTEFHTKEIKIRGKPLIVDQYNKIFHSTNGKILGNLPADKFSSENSTEGENGVGSLLVRKPLQEEKKEETTAGFLHELWNEATMLSKETSSYITSIASYCNSSKWSTNKLTLIELTPFDENSTASEEQKKWVHINSNLKKALRRVLILRISLPSIEVYIIEAERDEYNNGIEKEARGLVFSTFLPLSETTINEFIHAIKSHAGIMHKVAAHFNSDRIKCFNHPPHGATSKARGALVNAIKKALA